jgi:hypothetical protein
MMQPSMENTKETAVIVASKDQASASLPGETVILSPASGAYYGLDEVGTRVWELIQEPIPIEGIMTAIIEEYDVEPDRCKSDLFALLQELSNAGLIEIRDEATP